MGVSEAEVSMYALIGCLAPDHADGDFPFGFLAFLAPAGGLSFAGGGAAAAANLFVVGGEDVGEGGED